MCIPRDDMPQIDMADLPGLLAYLNTKKIILISDVNYPPTWLVPKQCLNQTRPATNPKLATKPLLISRDLYIIDGHHRWMMHMEQYKADASWRVRCFQLDREFDECCAAIASYPGAYKLGDGPQPYRI